MTGILDLRGPGGGVATPTRLGARWVRQVLAAQDPCHPGFLGRPGAEVVSAPSGREPGSSSGRRVRSLLFPSRSRSFYSESSEGLPCVAGVHHY